MMIFHSTSVQIWIASGDRTVGCKIDSAAALLLKCGASVALMHFAVSWRKDAKSYFLLKEFSLHNIG